MNIGFIVDASNEIGLGHWSRCINLSKIFNKKNYFFSRYYPVGYQKIKNINLIKIKKGKFSIEEIKNKINKFNIKVLIIDNYSFNFELQQKIKKYIKKLIVIDDYYNKKYFSDVLLNYSFLDKSEKIILKKNNPKVKFALGPKYLPLNFRFFELKKNLKPRKKIEKILIFFGGADKINITEKILVISKFFKNINFSVIVGGLNKKKISISKKVQNYKNINLFYKIKNEKVADLIVKNDLAIGAGGVNLFERIYLGLPSIVVDVDKNQLINIKNSKNKGLIVHLKNENFTIDKLVNTIQTFIKNRNKFKKISMNCFNCLKLDQKKHLNRLLDFKE